MAYIEQPSVPVEMVPKIDFDAALKEYQQKVVGVQAEIKELTSKKESIETEVSAVLSSKRKLLADCDVLKKNAGLLQEQIRQEVLQAEKNIEEKRSALAEDLEKQKAAIDQAVKLTAKEQGRLADLQDKIAAKAEELGKRQDVIASNEVISTETLSKAEEMIEEATKRKSSNDELEAELMQKDVALKTVSEELAAESERQKVRKAKLDQETADLALASADLQDRLLKVQGLEAAQEKFAADKVDFGAARDRLAVREMAVAEAEAQVKNWANDLKQREKLLAEKYKGE